MADVGFEIDWSQIKRFGEACLEAPHTVSVHLAKALAAMGKSDITKLRSEQLSGGGGGLNVQFKGLRNAFKYKATDPEKAFNLSKLFLDEYTRWPGAKIFQTGGVITPKRAKNLTILFPGMKSKGKRKIKQKELRALIDSGEARIIKTTKGPLIIREKVKYTKKGNVRKGAKTEILAALRPMSRQKKRLSFFENFNANAAEHERLLNEACEKALQEMAK